MMRDLDEMLRTVKFALIGLTLVSVGIVAGLVLSTTFDGGAPETRPTVAAARQASAPPAASPGANSVPNALLPHDNGGSAPLESPFVEVARRVVPAVVSVEGRRTISHPPVEGPEGDIFRRMFPDRGREDEDEDDGEIEMPSSGSGFIFDGAGYIFTNDHVVSDSETMTIRTADGRSYEARLIGSDPGTDVAVIKVDLPAGAAPLPTVPLGDSDEVRVGDWAIAVGNPLGELEGTLTVGVISAKGRKDLRIAGGGPVYQDFLQTDASITFGNSGGPLVNGRGEVIGINSAVNPNGQGIGFSIPINLARRVGVELIRTGTVRRGYLGILPQEVTDVIREAWDMPDLAGILVGSVEKDTPAQRSGLRVGDVILEFNNRPVREVSDFRAAVADAGVGVSVPVKYLREGREGTIQVVLTERPDTPAPPAAGTAPAHPDRGGDWIGASLEDIDPELVEAMRLTATEGVVVTDLAMGGPAMRAGLRTGDVILEVNRNPVKTRAEVQRELERARSLGKPAVLLVQRGPTTTFVAIRPD